MIQSLCRFSTECSFIHVESCYEATLNVLIVRFHKEIVARQPNSDTVHFVVEISRSHTHTHTHTHTTGMTPLNEWPARRRGRYLHSTQQTQQTNIHVFEPAIPTIKRPQTYVSDCTVAGIGRRKITTTLLYVTYVARVTNRRVSHYVFKDNNGMNLRVP
jgi:hypothetical protein